MLVKSLRIQYNNMKRNTRGGKCVNRSLKEWGIKIAILMIGLAIAHLGVTLFLLSDLGSDPFNVLVQGIFRSLNYPFLTHGRTHIGISLLIILTLLFIDKSYIKIGTALCMLFGGPIIDLFTGILSPLLGALESMAARILMLAVGCVILAYGMTLVIRSDAGTGPNDLVALVISEKRNWKFGIVRVAVDAVFTATGFLLGGVAGIGTLICMFLVGPVAGFFLPINGRMVEKMIRKALSKDKME